MCDWKVVSVPALDSQGRPYWKKQVVIFDVDSHIDYEDLILQRQEEQELREDE